MPRKTDNLGSARSLIRVRGTTSLRIAECTLNGAQQAIMGEADAIFIDRAQFANFAKGAIDLSRVGTLSEKNAAFDDEANAKDSES